MYLTKPTQPTNHPPNPIHFHITNHLAQTETSDKEVNIIKIAVYSIALFVIMMRQPTRERNRVRRRGYIDIIIE